LKGSFVFLADLIRAMNTPTEIDFIRARSYGKGTTSSGAVEITKDIETAVLGRHVIVVEDILDTGLTVDVVVDRLEIGNPESVRRCALLVREGSTEPEFWGRHIGPGFVVGYGIDYAEEHRGMPDIRIIPGT
jgi:hypoxanthine phosphoribosyltransferase